MTVFRKIPKAQDPADIGTITLSKTKTGKNNKIGRKHYGADARGILGLRDFTENLQKTLFESFSNANKKPSKNPKKPSKNPPAAP